MKEKEIAEIAARMKRFERGIVCKSKDVTIEADWNPVGDGGGVYLIEYYKGETESRMFIHYAGFWWLDLECYDSFDEFKKETPKTFQNILLKLVEILNEKDTKEKMKKEKQISQEAQEKINNIGKLINEAKNGLYDFIEGLVSECIDNITSMTRFYNEIEIYEGEDEYNKEKRVLEEREIEPLKKLCDTLNIDVPKSLDVYVSKPSLITHLCDVHIVKNSALTIFCYNEDRIYYFFSGWVHSCANSVIQQAQERIGNLLETGC